MNYYKILWIVSLKYKQKSALLGDIMKITITLPEKEVRDLVSDLVPQMLSAKSQDHELVLVFDEKKVKGFGQLNDGKKKVTKKGTGLVLKGNHTEVELTAADIKKMQ